MQPPKSRKNLTTGEKREFFRKYSPMGSSLDLYKDAASQLAAVRAAAGAAGSSVHSLVLDPTGRLAHYWSGLVSLAVVYYMWSVAYRVSFAPLPKGALWMTLDTLAYVVYLMDVFIQMRTSFLKDGILENDINTLSAHYVATPECWLDVTAVLPLDLAYMATRWVLVAPPLLGLPRLLKIYRLRQFADRAETRSHLPNMCRAFFVVHNLLVAIHWNACLYFLISNQVGFGADRWVYPSWNTSETAEWGSLSRQYIYSFYWSALTLTTIGELPAPETDAEYLFVTVDYLIGVLMFATLVGDIGAIIENMQKARMKFQNKMDSIKRYMNLTKVPSYLQERVIKWFDYLWSHGHTISDDQQTLSALPDKLKAEIGMHVHFDTLRKVEFFQECEGGLLWELVLRLRTQIYSPGEYVCRKGDVGREMYIVNRGKLEVLTSENSSPIRELAPGEYFGEISVLNLGRSQHRRTAFVRSVGYSDLLCLTQSDLMDVLKHYPLTLRKLRVRGDSTLREEEEDSGLTTMADDTSGEGAGRGATEDLPANGDEDEEDTSDRRPPIELFSLADQVVTMHNKIAKLETALEQLLYEVKKLTAPEQAEAKEPPKRRHLPMPAKPSRKISSIF